MAFDTEDIQTEDIQTENIQTDEQECLQTKKRLPWSIVIAAIVVVAVVLFALLWETVYLSRVRDNRSNMDNGSQATRSEIQYELNNSDWVSKRFLPYNEYSRPGIMTDGITGIVIHYIGNPGTTAMQNRDYFANLAVTQETNASSNFIIGIDGEIIQCVPVDEIAYASNTRNADTISIELCHPDDTGEFTDETYKSAVFLTVWLCKRYGLSPDDIIRHYDVTGKICPKYFVENEDAWEAFKDDVGVGIGN